MALASVPIYNSPDLGAEAFAEVQAGQIVHIIRQTPAGWARLQFTYLHKTSYEYVFGWAPLQMGGASFNRANLAGCTRTPDVAWLAAMSPAEHLVCFGVQHLQLEGWATVQGFGPWLYSGEPDWLATPTGLLLMSVDPEVGGPAVPIHVAPTLGQAWPVGSRVTVTATFNHEASASCRRTGPTHADPVADEESILWCQQQLVVEEFHISGG